MSLLFCFLRELQHGSEIKLICLYEDTLYMKLNESKSICLDEGLSF